MAGTDLSLWARSATVLLPKFPGQLMQYSSEATQINLGDQRGGLRTVDLRDKLIPCCRTSA